MRIAIPSDDGITIAPHTGRASGFVIYDIKKNKAVRHDYRTNSYTAHALGQCDKGEAHSKHHSHDGLLDALHDCKVMVAHGMGPRLVHDLASRNIQVLFCEDSQADDAARNLAAGKLVTRDTSGCHK